MDRGRRRGRDRSARRGRRDRYNGAVGVRGPAYAARAVWFDPRNDIAVLSVPALRGISPLRLATAGSPGTAVGIVGYPEDGPLSVEPGRIGGTSTVLTQDAYGNGPVSRLVTSLSGLVRPGNSGGPLVDAGGQVAGTVFASSTSSPRAGFAVPDGVVSGALGRAAGPVATGHCAG